MAPSTAPLLIIVVCDRLRRVDPRKICVFLRGFQTLSVTHLWFHADIINLTLAVRQNLDSGHMPTAQHLCVVMLDHFWKRIPLVGRIALDIVIVGRAVMIKA
jgi:hypothetical protein